MIIENVEDDIEMDEISVQKKRLTRLMRDKTKSRKAKKIFLILRWSNSSEMDQVIKSFSPSFPAFYENVEKVLIEKFFLSWSQLMTRQVVTRRGGEKTAALVQR